MNTTSAGSVNESALNETAVQLNSPDFAATERRPKEITSKV